MASVLLGMSGGVDSSVAAYRLLGDGYTVFGITFIMHNSHLECVEGARAVCDALGIEHSVLDLREEFAGEVITPFVSEYEHGRTPNPCILCNAKIKFPYLLREADRRGIDYIATGHYASLSGRDGHRIISAAADTSKDQSYFLYMLGEDILSRLLLPLADMTKPSLRALAESLSLPSASSPDSQDVCFIPDGDTRAFVSSRLSGEAVVGNFITTDGKLLGPHRGIPFYTIGQRKGLGVSYTHPLFVQSINRESGDIVLCSGDELYRHTVFAEDAKYFSGTLPSSPFRASVRLRYSRHSGEALLTNLGDGRVRIDFDTPQRAPTPGQAAVFFDGDYLLGGAVIVSSDN